MIRLLAFFALLTSAQELVPADANWAYLDGQAQAETGWYGADFDDSTWKRGPGPLGYSRHGLGTIISFGEKKGRKAMRACFRHRFELTDTSQIRVLTLFLERDDGAMAYLNGKEVARSNMPAGRISADTPAEKSIGGDAETTEHRFDLDPSVLLAGPNLLAVAVHPDGGCPGSGCGRSCCRGVPGRDECNIP